jgi:hypothetical protein
VIVENDKHPVFFIVLLVERSEAPIWPSSKLKPGEVTRGYQSGFTGLSKGAAEHLERPRCHNKKATGLLLSV